jgi:hypothetical protein
MRLLLAMAFISDADINRALQSGEVKLAVLFEMSFVSGISRAWTGIGKLVTHDDLVWSGLGEVIQISGLQQGVGLSSNQSTLTISGATKEWVKTALANEYEARGRDITIFIQIFNNDNTKLGEYFAVSSGIMQNLKFSANGPDKRTITIPIEGMLTRRRRPVFSWYTDSDQQKRFPGDKGLSFVNEILNKSVTWPDY